MTPKYCYIENSEIIEGPKTLPKSWRNVSGLHNATDERLLELGWLPYVDDGAPEYDTDTQYVTAENVVGESAVTKTYTVNDYSEIAERLETARLSKLADLYTNVKRFISTQPNGWPRYDDDLKLNIMNASMTAIAAGNDKPAACVSVETWIYTVQMWFFTLKAAVNAAEDFATLNAIDVTYDTLEAQYGREGSVAADPGVSTDDIVGS